MDAKVECQPPLVIGVCEVISSGTIVFHGILEENRMWLKMGALLQNVIVPFTCQVMCFIAYNFESLIMVLNGDQYVDLEHFLNSY